MKSTLFKITLFTLALVSFSFLTHSQSKAQSHNFATFNIRYANPNDVGNLWEDRLPHVASLIQFHQISLFGIQEGLHHQVTGLAKSLDYSFIGVGREDGTEKGEYAAILYDAQKYKLLENGTFWLSPTPERPSKGWDAAFNRICTWGKFEDQEGTEFFVFNVHYDHIGQQAREESSKLVLSKVDEINKENLPVLLMGDFNIKPENPAYQTIVSKEGWRDARLVSKIPSYGPAGSFTGFDWERIPDGIIDHVFAKGRLTVIRHGILTDNYGKKYPSDHFPVLVEVMF